MHALLTPGTHVLRRSPRLVQVGLGPAATVRLRVPTDPDEWDPGDLRAWRDVPAPVLARLAAAGLAARDDRSLREALPGSLPDPLPGQDTGRDTGTTSGAHRRWQRHTVAALFRTAPEAMSDVVAERRRCEVTLRTFGAPLGASLADDLAELCRRTGLPLAVDRAPGPPRKGAAEPRPVSVVVGLGEPRREALDPLVRDGVPHLLVRMVEGAAVVGPFVVPGSTPCLRCLDAHLAVEDPAWPLLVEQYAHATAHDRPDGVPEPVDAALAALAIAWAARDVATYAGGGSPVTLATTVRVAPALEALETRSWLPHPGCGCGWT